MPLAPISGKPLLIPVPGMWPEGKPSVPTRSLTSRPVLHLPRRYTAAQSGSSRTGVAVLQEINTTVVSTLTTLYRLLGVKCLLEWYEVFHHCVVMHAVLTAGMAAQKQ